MSAQPTGTADADVAGVHEVITDLYVAVLHGDRPRFDRHLDPAVTTWESHLPDLLMGLAALDDYRDRRAAAGAQPSLAALDADQVLVDVHGDLAVARYELTAREKTDSMLRFRVTDVLRRDGDRWLILHHHSERVATTEGAS